MKKNEIVSLRTPDSPCKDCEWRQPGCHNECEGYRKFKEQVEKIRARRVKENEYAGFMSAKRRRMR